MTELKLMTDFGVMDGFKGQMNRSYQQLGTSKAERNYVGESHHFQAIIRSILGTFLSEQLIPSTILVTGPDSQNGYIADVNKLESLPDNLTETNEMYRICLEKNRNWAE